MPLGPPSKRPSNAGPDPDRGWRLIQQGSFALGECRACGYRSPARRAPYSVAEDMDAHDVLCRSSRDL